MSSLPAAFQPIGRGKKRRLLCPYCAREERHRQSQLTFVNLAFLLLLGSLVAALGKTDNPGWLLLNVALFIVMSWIQILPHEAGHALAARLMGLNVERIVVGTGRKLTTFVVMGLPIEIHQYPAGGLTYIAVRNAPYIRVKWALIVLAGPLVNFLAIWIAMRWGSTALAAEKIEGGLAPVSMFIAANFLILLGNLWPRKVMTEFGPSVTDGAQLISLLTGKPYDFAAAEHALEVRRLQSLFERRQWDALQSSSRRYLESRPDDHVVQIQWSAALIHLHRLPEARELLEGMVTNEAMHDMYKAIAANNLAWVYLVLDDDSLGDKALERAIFAFGLMPWESSIASTYGCAHALFGDAGIAERVLTSERVQKNPEKTRASSLAGLAIAQERLVRREAAGATLRSASDIDANAQLMNIARRRLGEVDTSAATSLAHAVRSV